MCVLGRVDLINSMVVTYKNDIAVICLVNYIGDYFNELACMLIGLCRASKFFVRLVCVDRKLYL